MSRTLAVVLSALGVVGVGLAVLSVPARADLPPPDPALTTYDVPVTAAANVATSSITFTHHGAARLTLALTDATNGGAASIVDLVISDGTNTLSYALNDGTALDAGEVYTFSFGVNKDWTYNLSPRTTTRVLCQLDLVKEGL